MNEQERAQLLLNGEVAAPRKGRRWAYPLWGMVLLSAGIAYHAGVLLVWNMPSNSLSERFHKTFLDRTKARPYFRATSNTQSWAMFAPNPNRTNAFIRAIVTDQDGTEWDMHQDIWGIDRYPYFFYDRRGKVNRRIDGKKGYQTAYGAWLCREWERTHEGVPAKKVRFIKRYTRVPKPGETWSKWGIRGYWPWELPYKQVEQETVNCERTKEAQLSPELRERYGLGESEEGYELVPATARTWADEKEAEERRARLDERRASNGRARVGEASEETGEREPKPGEG